MIYLDSSCLLKLVRSEEGSDAVATAIASETDVIISSLAEVETLIDLRCSHLAGLYTAPAWKRHRADYQSLRDRPPFSYRLLTSAVWDVAIRQYENSLHCRTLDRLHLAAAELFGATRIMTLDTSQAKAARALGFQVIAPR
jgi:predicted nucleic acid-binding protein